LDACVHCGFCLQACPTYLALDDENDSPRGRIVLMHALLDGTISPFDSDLHTHIDRCLGCRGCETACPSGVPYGHLLEATRATLRDTTRLPLPARLLLWLATHPRLWRVTMSVVRFVAASPFPTLAARLPSRYGFAMAMLAASEMPLERGTYTPDREENRERVAILLGCVMDGLFSKTNAATERVLVHNGYRSVAAPGQGCCGALHAHAGQLDTARRLARRNIAAFERSGADFLAVNAAGCGAMCKDYGALLRDDPEWAARAAAMSAKVRDVTELLADAGPKIGGVLPFRVTYDAPCHLCHAQRVVSQPLQVLSAIPGMTLVPLRDAEQCCGSAGIYNLVEPDTADAVLDAKLANVHATGAALVATGNPGCLMQIGAGMLRAGMSTRAIHPVDLLDASYAADG
jgi:glycolate oxidase iron-sulfur subunit